MGGILLRQESFSRLWDGFETDEAAKAARNARYRKLCSDGYVCKRSVLTNQLKQYERLRVPDGRSCDVYMIDVFGHETMQAREERLMLIRRGLC